MKLELSWQYLFLINIKKDLRNYLPGPYGLSVITLWWQILNHSLYPLRIIWRYQIKRNPSFINKIGHAALLIYFFSPA